MKDKYSVLIYDIEVALDTFTITLALPDLSKSIFLVVNKDQDDRLKIIKIFDNKKRWFVGWNNREYDNQIMAFILHEKEVMLEMSALDFCAVIQARSNMIIEDGDKSYKYQRYFRSIDAMRIGRKGNINKALKLTAVNLKHKLIQDLPYKAGESLNVPLEKVQYYNYNDVEITQKAYKWFIDSGEILLRRQISSRYGIDVMSEPDSGIADRLLELFYEEATGFPKSQFKRWQTIRTKIYASDCISDKIKFKTSDLQNLLSDLKRKILYKYKPLSFEVYIKNRGYDLKKGGLHSIHPKSTIHEESKDYYLIDVDATSFYPFIVILLGLYPEHLGPPFLEVYKRIVKERLIAKRSGDVVKAAAYKIVANSTYGKFGDEFSWLYDLLLTYSTTLNGQLFLLMLIEALEENKFPIVYANTDGITVRVEKTRLDLFHKICKSWMKYTQFQLEFVRFSKYVIRDVNNIIACSYKEYMLDDNCNIINEKDKNKVKVKGIFNPDAWNNLTDKMQFDKPIVSRALYEYFVNDISVDETIKNCDDILDFCMAQKVGSTWSLGVKFSELDIQSGKMIEKEAQKVNRYYVVSKGGGILTKHKLEISGLETKQKFVSGEMVKLLNDFDNDDKPEPKYSWYIKQAMNEISKFPDVNQLSLF